MTEAEKIIALLKEKKRQALDKADKETGITESTMQRIFAEVVQQCIDVAEKVITK